MEYSEKIKAKKVFIDKIIIVILHTYILSIPFSTGLCRFLPVVAFLLWFFSSYYMGLKNLLKEYPLFKYIGMFVLYIIFSLMWSDSLHDGFKEIEDYLYWVVLVVFALAILLVCLFNVKIKPAPSLEGSSCVRLGMGKKFSG